MSALCELKSQQGFSAAVNSVIVACVHGAFLKTFLEFPF